MSTKPALDKDAPDFFLEAPSQPQDAPVFAYQIDLAFLSLDELLTLRHNIDERLPVKSLKDINLAQELVAQLQVVKKLQREVLEDTQTPANQMAQVANSVASVLASLSKLQNETYDSERLKRVESVLIEALNELPMGVQDEFLSKYEALLGASGD